MTRTLEPILDPARTPQAPATRHAAPRRRRPLLLAAGLTLTAVALGIGALAVARHVRDADLNRDYLGVDGLPTAGQTAVTVGSQVRVTGGQQPVPIASVAKVMTAYVVLRALPLTAGGSGPVLTVAAEDVREYEQRRDSGQSVVRVAAGERLTERQALLALLLPSANNVATMLARRVAGGVPAFVARMNAAASELGMLRTVYTDPSGYLTTTVSTAADQLLLARAVAGDDPVSSTFTALAATDRAVLPVVGEIRSTNALLNSDGVIGTKTGSDDAAGGCMMFRSYRVVDRQVTDVVGVVLGQHGRHDITAGLYAAKQLLDRIGPAAGA